MPRTLDEIVLSVKSLKDLIRLKLLCASESVLVLHSQEGED
jgi:hypothetical protein